MWEVIKTDDYKRAEKRYGKKRPMELAAVQDNFDTYLRALNAGTKPLQVAGGFIHREPNGVVAIDQKGGGVALAQTRLYVYPDSDASQLHVIALGDKKSQKADIQTCREYVASLRKAKEAAHDEKDDSEE